MTLLPKGGREKKRGGKALRHVIVEICEYERDASIWSPPFVLREESMPFLKFGGTLSVKES